MFLVLCNILGGGEIVDHSGAFGKLDILWVFRSEISGCGYVWVGEVAHQVAAVDVLVFWLRCRRTVAACPQPIFSITNAGKVCSKSFAHLVIAGLPLLLLLLPMDSHVGSWASIGVRVDDLRALDSGNGLCGNDT